MSIWEDVKIEDSVIGEGIHHGRITAAAVKKTKASDTYIELKMKFDDFDGFVWDRLNLTHEKTAEISRKSVKMILAGAYFTVPPAIETYEELAGGLSNIPVAVKIKHKGTDEDGRMKLGIYYAPEKVPAAYKTAYGQKY
jgi:hypothetical protein